VTLPGVVEEVTPDPIERRQLIARQGAGHEAVTVAGRYRQRRVEVDVQREPMFRGRAGKTPSGNELVFCADSGDRMLRHCATPMEINRHSGSR